MKLIHQHFAGLPLTHVHLLLPRTGACLDPANRRGLTRLTLRLLVAGAGGLSHAAFNGRLERLGAAMGSSLASDYLSLRLTTLTENLDAALDLFLLALREPDFTESEFQRLRAELVSSWVAEREESKYVRAQEVYQSLIYHGQPQAYQADGTLEGLKASALEDLRAQWTRLLGATEPVLAVLSDLTREDAQARVAERLQLPAPRADTEHPWDRFLPPPNGGRRAVLVPETGTKTDEVLLGGFTTSERDPDWHVHRMIALIFGGDMNSRLFRVVRGEHGFSYGASCWYESAAGRCPRHRIAPFSLYTFPSAEHTAQAVPLLLRLYEELVSGGVTPEELRRAQQALVNSYPFQHDTPQKKLGRAIDRELYGIVPDAMEEHRRKLLSTTPEDVLRVLRATHGPALEAMNVVLLGDPARLEPVLRTIPGLKQMEIVNYP
jgi:zinc protease